MLHKLLVLLTMGFLWLFVFSIPVDSERKVFDVGHAALVDTKPMHWLVGKVRHYFDMTRGKVTEAAQDVLPESVNKVSQAGSRDATP